MILQIVFFSTGINFIKEYEKKALQKPARFSLISDGIDTGLLYYRNPFSKYFVIEFYNKITKNEIVTRAILKYSDIYNIPLGMAFAIALTESGFNIKAINYNSDTIDRGLFQLNNTSFPKLKEKDFYNPDINAKNGLEYLRKCIDEHNDTTIALAMYNAGAYRVEKKGTPLVTLKYISHIRNRQDKIEEKFRKEIELPGFTKAMISSINGKVFK